jgi:hypothetical protein
MKYKYVKLCLVVKRDRERKEKRTFGEAGSVPYVLTTLTELPGNCLEKILMSVWPSTVKKNATNEHE